MATLKFILIFSLINCSLSANILFVSLLASPSHHIWNEALAGGLLENGHNITKLGHFPLGINSPNYTLIYVSPEFMNTIDDDFIDKTMQESKVQGIIAMWSYAAYMCKFSYVSEEFQKILAYPKDFFDAIIYDVTFAHCFFPIMDHFNRPPIIGVTAFGMQPYINQMIGQRTESYLPFYALPYTDKMTFTQRINNVFHQSVELLCRWWYLKELTAAAREFFGQNIPNLSEYERTVSLIFSNDDPVLDYAKPFPPNVIPVGGIHVKKPKKLDGDIQRIMDESKDGVVFVSMGSNFKAKHYKDAVKKAFTGAFAKLNQTVLWKFEDDVVVSKNVHLRKWYSQTDILAHPNTKLFVTHCGGLSTQETIIRGVPVVGIPLFADQHYKGEKYRSFEGGVILKYSELTTENLFNGINEVLSNPKYKKNVMKMSKLYQSHPQQPMEKFLLWTDYILNNKDLDHLSVQARDMEWYQVNNWDIFGVYILILGIVVFIFKKLCRFVCKNAPRKKQKAH